MTVIWHLIHPEATPEMLGYIPDFIDDADPGDARTQINEKYLGGWHPLPGFKLYPNKYRLLFGKAPAPDNPPLLLLAVAQLRNETLCFYTGEWLAVFQPDETFEVARLD